MKRLFGLLAVGGMLMVAAPMTTANAASLINPATSAATAAQLAGTGVTDVRWHWRRHPHFRHHWRWRRWRHHHRHW